MPKKFWKRLKSLIQAKIDNLGQKFNSWDKIMAKPLMLRVNEVFN